MSFRFGEHDRVHFRTGRCHRASEQWFFSTRENLGVGPFSTKDEAEVELFFYLRRLGVGVADIGFPELSKHIKYKA